MTFTTIADVTAFLFDVDHGFADDITEEQMRDIVNDNRTNRYDELTDDEINAMIVAAYMAAGADEMTAHSMLRN